MPSLESNWLPITVMSIAALVIVAIITNRYLERRTREQKLVVAIGRDVVGEVKNQLQDLAPHILNRTEFVCAVGSYRIGFWLWQRDYHVQLEVNVAEKDDCKRIEPLAKQAIKKFRVKAGNPTFRVSLSFNTRMFEDRSTDDNDAERRTARRIG